MVTKRRRSARRNTNLLTNLVLILPLLVIYEVGVLFTRVANGADFITGTLLAWLGFQGFLLTQALVLAFVFCLLVYLRTSQRFETRQLLPILVESGAYALIMGTVIVLVMVDLLGIDPRLAWAESPQLPFDLAQSSVLTRIVLSVGAGVHEEIVFRLILMSGLILLTERGFGWKRWIALPCAVAISATLFAGAHHLGPLGEPLRLGVFVYRSLAGALFALLFYWRGIAVSVYTHAFYDLYVLFAV